MTTIHRSRRWRVAAVALVGVLALASCSSKKSTNDSASSSNSSGSGTTIRITSQDFSEQKTLADVYGQYLKAQGFKTVVQPPIGTRTQIFTALKAGKVDLELDYSGSAVTELKGTASNDADATFAALQKVLKPLKLEASTQSAAEDNNALVALKTYADKNSLKTISDLASIDGTLTLGGAAECATRPECLLGYNGPKYALNLKFKAVDYGPPLVDALKAGEIQVAQYGTTAPEIAEGTIVVLKDDKGLQSAQNVVPIYRSAVASSKLTTALDTLSAKITSADLASWNESTDVKKQDPADVAAAWLQAKGLVK